MASENEPAKLLLPYLQRADELQKHEPLVAYYCRLYAMERGLKIPQSERTKTTNALLVSLMKQLEKDKKSLKLGPDDHLHLEGFALNVFAKADKQDRSGRADLNTAKTFYAASIFFEILNQFGEIQPDLDEKQKYAAWKAADIRRALKEGRNPVPGPPGGGKDLSIPSNTSSGEYDLEPSRMDPASKPVLDRDPSREFYDDASPQHTANVPPPSGDRPSPPSHPTASYPSHDFHPPPSTNRSENSSYSQPYHHQPFPQEPEQNFPQNYPSQDIPSYSHPNFQSHPSFSEASHPAAPPSDYPMHYLGSSPSFTESSRPAAPSDYPSHYQGTSPGFTEASRPAAPSDYPSQHYQGSSPSFTEASRPAAPSDYPLRYQGSDETYSTLSAPTTKNYPSTAQYNSTDKNGTVSEAARTSAPSYQYDSNYQPTPEKIAEAHKAARFAVGALAFDDVSIAVDYLKKSLELLTNPSAGQ